jgi:hypothetical protein
MSWSRAANAYTAGAPLWAMVGEAGEPSFGLAGDSGDGEVGMQHRRTLGMP